jgi:hypothetical protein
MARSMHLFMQLLATFVLFYLASQVSIVTAQPTTVLFDNCPPTSATEGNPGKRLNITTIYAQIAHWNASSDPTLKMTLLGETGDGLEGYSNTTGYLGTSIPASRLTEPLRLSISVPSFYSLSPILRLGNSLGHSPSAAKHISRVDRRTLLLTSFNSHPLHQYYVSQLQCPRDIHQSL